ncbi:MAG: pentapeptide repeat-containing protein [Leptolyngbya sp. BL-A-14]
MKRSQRPPKPLPFTETQIRERAYKLWQAGSESTSAEDNWQAAIESLKQERSPIWRMRQWLLYPLRLLTRFLQFFWRLPEHLVRLVRLALTAETPSAALDVVKVIISAFGVLATIFAGVGLYLTYRNSQSQLEAAQQERQLNTERLLTDRFAKAVEQLGSQNIHVRLGSIYSLERIAKDSPKDYWTVLEVLTAFVRNNSPVPSGWTRYSKQKLPNVTTDVQAALTVIGRREAKNDPADGSLNLQSTNLNGAELGGANLSHAYLYRASFWGAQLYGTNFNGAVLLQAYLGGSYLSHASFKNANLFMSNISQADLNNTYFDNADLEAADLTNTYFTTTAQIKAAQNWQKARYSSTVRKQLGLPPQKP